MDDLLSYIYIYIYIDRVSEVMSACSKQFQWQLAASLMDDLRGKAFFFENRRDVAMSSFGCLCYKTCINKMVT